MEPRKFALIENGVVINIIVMYAKNLKEFPNAVLIEGTDVGIGWAYINGEFINPNPQEIPQE